MKCKGRRGKPELLGDVTGRHAVGPGLHQKAKDIEARFLRERAQRGEGFPFLHISIIVEIWNLSMTSGMVQHKMTDSIIDRIVLRGAGPEEFAFCERLYFDGVGWIIDALKLDPARQRDAFRRKWQWADVRIIALDAEDVGWLQTTSTADAIFLARAEISHPRCRENQPGA